MKVGVTGHQQRQGIDWSWVARSIRAELAKFCDVRKTFSSLAVGTDQVFAAVAIEMGLSVTAVLPLEGYERFFQGEGLVEYRRLLSRCEVVQLDWKGDPERAFFEAGKYIVESCDVLIAVWDGAPAKGNGGTADVVAYAHDSGCRIRHINPLKRSVVTI